MANKKWNPKLNPGQAEWDRQGIPRNKEVIDELPSKSGVTEQTLPNMENWQLAEPPSAPDTGMEGMYQNLYNQGMSQQGGAFSPLMAYFGASKLGDISNIKAGHERAMKVYKQGISKEVDKIFQDLDDGESANDIPAINKLRKISFRLNSQFQTDWGIGKYLDKYMEDKTKKELAEMKPEKVTSVKEQYAQAIYNIPEEQRTPKQKQILDNYMDNRGRRNYDELFGGDETKQKSALEQKIQEFKQANPDVTPEELEELIQELKAKGY